MYMLSTSRKKRLTLPSQNGHSTVVLVVTVPFFDGFVSLLVLFCNTAVVYLYCFLMVLSSNVGTV